VQNAQLGSNCQTYLAIHLSSKITAKTRSQAGADFELYILF
jgi:hypothetical protein